MTDKRCILKNVEITESNDSRAHVLPMALGWRYAPKGVLCRTANTLIADKIDLPLVDGFLPLAAQLGIARQKGETPPIRVTDDSGAELIFEFGEPFKLSRPRFEEQAIAGGHRYAISARTIAEARKLLGRVKKTHAEIDIEAVLAQARRAQEWPDGYIKSSVQMGPTSVFPASFTGASIYAAALAQPIHPNFRSYVEGFDTESPTLPPDTFYFVRDDKWIRVPGEVSHIVAYIGDPQRKAALVYTEVFNSAGVAVLLPYNGAERIVEARSVDVLKGIESTPQIDQSLVFGSEWKATHVFPDASIQEILRQRLETVVRIGARRARKAAEHNMRTRLGLTGEMPRDGAGMINMLDGLVNFTKLLWKRGTTTDEDRIRDLRNFQLVCANLRLCIPASDRPAFDEKAMSAIEELALLATTT